MKWFSFLTLLLTLSPIALANYGYFYVRTSQPKLNWKNELSLTIQYDLDGLSEDEFLILPHAEPYYVKIFDDKSGEWVWDFSNAENLPQLSRNALVMIDGFESEVGTLFLDVIHKKSQTTYYTNKIKFYNKPKTYMDLLNQNILSFKSTTSSKPPEILESVTEEIETTPSVPNSAINYWILVGCVILGGILMLALQARDKIPK